jgi:hypothetical protein
MVPPAPGRFSTTTVCLSEAPTFSKTMRPTMSITPAGAKGTKRRMLREGYAAVSACAETTQTNSPAIAAAPNRDF